MRWNDLIEPSANTLNGSLTWPGDSNDYTPLPGGDFRGYQEPGDPNDREMHIEDWLASNTGAVNSDGVRDTLIEHIRLGRTLRLIVYNNTIASGQNLEYQIAGFAVFRLHGFYLQGNGQSDSWILAEFIRWDNSCGQQLQSP